MSERDIDIEDVRRDHLESVNIPAHWAYLVGVLGGGLVVMLLFVTFLGQGV